MMAYKFDSVGGLYAYILSRNEKVQISVVARSNYNALKENVSPHF